MSEQFTREQLPSGKVIVREFDKSGALTKETHIYGALDIAITYDFKDGKRISETYFAKKKMVTRKTYEKTRVNYSDMPAADSAVEDFGADLIKGAAQERKQWRNEAKVHRPNSEIAQKIDSFCEKLLVTGKCEDAVTWIKNKQHTLGERSWASSKRLVEKLVAFGCSRIIACKIDQYEDGLENTGHLVVELPTDTPKRARILDEIDRIASKTGYRGDVDDGQSYAYIKLD